INAALEEGRFELFRMAIQPLQKIEVGAHYELLLRLKDETGRIVSPNDFMAAAERYGITPAIDRWVIENAFRWLVSEAVVREILRDPIDREMVRSINEIGHLTGKQTIAEFAENAEIIQMLTSLGVDYAQGYGIAQPQRVLKAAVA